MRPHGHGHEAQSGHRVLVGPDPDGQGGSLVATMGDEVRVRSTGQVGKLIRRRVGSRDDDVVVVLVGDVAIETRSRDVLPWDGRS